jgi:hypothetical protein
VLTPATEDSGSVLVGVYDFSDGERMPGRDIQGRSLPDDALRVPVQRCSAGGRKPD